MDDNPLKRLTADFNLLKKAYEAEQAPGGRMGKLKMIGHTVYDLNKRGDRWAYQVWRFFLFKATDVTGAQIEAARKHVWSKMAANDEVARVRHASKKFATTPEALHAFTANIQAEAVLEGSDAEIALYLEELNFQPGEDARAQGAKRRAFLQALSRAELRELSVEKREQLHRVWVKALDMWLRSDPEKDWSSLCGNYGLAELNLPLSAQDCLVGIWKSTVGAPAHFALTDNIDYVSHGEGAKREHRPVQAFSAGFLRVLKECLKSSAETLTKVRLSHPILNSGVLEQLRRRLKECHQLKKLDLSGSPIGVAGWQMVRDELLKPKKMILESLDLSHTGMRNEWVADYCTLLRQDPTLLVSLKNIDLSGNKLTERAVFSFISAREPTRKVTIQLRDNAISKEAQKNWEKVKKTHPNLQLRF